MWFLILLCPNVISVLSSMPLLYLDEFLTSMEPYDKIKFDVFTLTLGMLFDHKNRKIMQVSNSLFSTMFLLCLEIMKLKISEKRGL